ncbi:hypothetical protein ACWIGI_28595 [Nocardia sp. NPDC055321]
MSDSYVALAAVIVSGVTSVATTWNFWYTQHRTDKREMWKWKREELQKLTAKFMATSAQRQSGLMEHLGRLETGGSFREGQTSSAQLAEEMLLTLTQIELVDEATAVAARAVYQLHRDAEDRYYPTGGDLYKEISDITVDPGELSAKHAALVEAFKQSVASQKPRRLPGQRSIPE